MGFKVVNKNVVVNREKNMVMDNIFYFKTKAEAEDYIEAQKSFYASEVASVIEECTEEEDAKYIFSQYHETYNPNDMQIPNVVIERPLEICQGVPYWVVKRELLLNN